MTKIKSWDENFNILLLVLLLTTMIGNYWMDTQGIGVGKIYFFMILASAAIIIFAFMFFKGDTMPELAKYIRVPFGTSLGVSSLMFLGGWGIFYLLNILFKFFGTKLTVASLSIPLFGNQILSGISQSFAAAKISSSIEWQIFNVSFNAGITEEFVFDFALVIMGALVGILLLKMFFREKIPFGLSSRTFVISFAILFSSLLFMGAHLLNDQYINPKMFLFALVFKVLSLVSIYFFGVFIMFWIGYHMANNFQYLVDINTATVVLNGLLSWVGLLYVALFGLTTWYLIRNWSSVKADLRSSF